MPRAGLARIAQLCKRPRVRVSTARYDLSPARLRVGRGNATSCTIETPSITRSCAAETPKLCTIRARAFTQAALPGGGKRLRKYSTSRRDIGEIERDTKRAASCEHGYVARCCSEPRGSRSARVCTTPCSLARPDPVSTNLRLDAHVLDRRGQRALRSRQHLPVADEPVLAPTRRQQPRTRKPHEERLVGCRRHADEFLAVALGPSRELPSRRERIDVPRSIDVRPVLPPVV
jgi:hypothetical protein